MSGLSVILHGGHRGPEGSGSEKRSNELRLHVHDDQTVEFIVTPCFGVVRRVGSERMKWWQGQVNRTLRRPEQLCMDDGREVLEGDRWA